MAPHLYCHRQAPSTGTRRLEELRGIIHGQRQKGQRARNEPQGLWSVLWLDTVQRAIEFARSGCKRGRPWIFHLLDARGRCSQGDIHTRGGVQHGLTRGAASATPGAAGFGHDFAGVRV